MPQWRQPPSYPGGPDMDDPEMDEPEGPTDAEMLDTLDPLAQSAYVITETYEDDPDAESEIGIYTDFRVFIHPDHPAGDILVAYVVVYDAPHHTETSEKGVFPISELGDLDKNTWFPAIGEVDATNEALALDGPDDRGLQGYIHWSDVDAAGEKFTTNLVRQVKRAIAHLDSGEEIPFSATLMEY